VERRVDGAVAVQPLDEGRARADARCAGDEDLAVRLQQERLCPLGAARCTGAGGWSACEYGPAYEANETTCDGVDNDCDGTRDEGCACPVGGPCGAQAQSRWDAPDAVRPWALEQLGGSSTPSRARRYRVKWVRIRGLCE
jgi:hypothetical protein